MSGKLLLAPPASVPFELGLEPLELEPLLLGGLGGSCLDSLAGNLQRIDNAIFQPLQGNGPIPLLIALLVHVNKEAVLLVDAGGQLFPQEATLLLCDALQMVQAHGGVNLGVHLVHVLAPRSAASGKGEGGVLEDGLVEQGFVHGRTPWMVGGGICLERWKGWQPTSEPFCIVEVLIELAVHDGFDVLLHIFVVGAAPSCGGKEDPFL